MATETTFGGWLRQQRRRLDWTQVELAQRVGYSVAMIRKLERDELRPSKHLAELLAHELDVAVAQHAGLVNFARSTPTPGLAPDAQPLHQQRRTTLSAQLTPFFGRTAEIVELTQALTNPATRLITIVGPGGMGKTRLALEVAQAIYELRTQIAPANYEHADQTRNSVNIKFSDGVYFVALVPLRTPEHIVPAIAEAINLRFQADNRPPKRQLLDYLRHKQLLLVLDNFEHLQAGAELIIELLQECAGLRLLLTSREHLQLSSETLFVLESLALPAVATLPDVLSYSAVQLFVETACRLRPKFTLTPANAQAIVRICQLVGGMPLGIILAAAWVEVLLPNEIVIELSQGFDFLAAELRDLPERQRSMRAVLTQSWMRLSDAERAVFMRLAVFRGGFTRTAAHRVADASLRMLSTLVNKSLVQCEPSGRYTIHELLRQFALESLEASNMLLATQANHVHYFLDFAERARRESGGTEDADLIKSLDLDIDNLRAALVWGTANQATELVLRLVTALQGFWDWRGYYKEMNYWFDQASALVEQMWSDLAVKDSDEYSPKQRQQIDIFAQMLLARADATMSPDMAEALYQRCLTLDQSIGITVRTVICYEALAHFARRHGNYTVADQWLRSAEQALQTLTGLNEHDRQTQQAFLFYAWGENKRYHGHLEECVMMEEQALALFAQLGNTHRVNYVRMLLSVVARYRGQHARAHSLMTDCHQYFTTVGDTDGSSWASLELGLLALTRGDIATAEMTFRESLTLMQYSDDYETYLYNFRGLAEVARQRQAFPFATRLLGAAEMLRQRIALVLPQLDQADFEATLFNTRTQLNAAAFAAAYAEGYAMSPAHAVAYALTDPTPQ